MTAGVGQRPKSSPDYQERKAIKRSNRYKQSLNYYWLFSSALMGNDSYRPKFIHPVDEYLPFPIAILVSRSSDSSEAVLLWHFSWMQWKALLLSSASCSLITHCKADRYFHQLHLSLGKSASFPLVHTQPVQKKYTVEKPEAFSRALTLWWDSGLLSSLKSPLSGRI